MEEATETPEVSSFIFSQSQTEPWREKDAHITVPIPFIPPPPPNVVHDLVATCSLSICDL